MKKRITWSSREAVWLTDDAKEALKLSAEGACVIFVLTGANREQIPSGVEYCVEPPEGAALWHDCSGSHSGKTGIPDWLDEKYLHRVWQRHAGLPWHILDTDRLSLRELAEDDLETLRRFYKDPDMRRFMAAPATDEDGQAERLRAYINNVYGFYEFGIWMITERETGKALGLAGLQTRENREEPELGFAVAAEHRGRGIAGEACRAVLRYGFEELELRSVRAVVHGKNENSLRLCEKLGFFVDKRYEKTGGIWIELLTVKG